jgi:predicted membrane protein
MPDQLKDIKDVIYIFDWGTIFFILFLAVLLIGLAYFFYKLFKKWRLNRKMNRKEDVVHAKPFNEIALEALMKIDPVEFFEKRKIKEYYFEITDIIREFLSSNYHIDTLDKTSLEIIEELERVERDFNKVKNLDNYFSDCDMVKFAKLRPGLAEMKQKKIESENIIKDCWKKV